jgi:hypothetical protein
MDTDTLRRFVDEAGFVFRGRVLAHRSADAPTVPAEAGEVLTAHIEEVLRSTDDLRGLAGREASVVTRHAGALRERHAVVLFTECISLGNQILVREIGHVEAVAENTRQIAEALREAEERPLRERVAAADLIVVGEVDECRALEREFPPRSEHDPEWWIARVAVASVLKGRKPRGEVEVLFANSTDIVWYKSPKLHKGTSGVFLLHRLKEDEAPRHVPRATYQATDPLDFLPIQRSASLRFPGSLGHRVSTSTAV